MLAYLYYCGKIHKNNITLWRFPQYNCAFYIFTMMLMISYAPLWKTMKEKNISQYYLLKHGIDNKTLDALKKEKNITLLTVEKLCVLLECTPNDIVVFLDR